MLVGNHPAKHTEAEEDDDDEEEGRSIVLSFCSYCWNENSGNCRLKSAAYIERWTTTQAVIGRTRGATCRYPPTAEMHRGRTHPGAAMEAAGVAAKGLGVLSAAASDSRGSRATDRPRLRLRALQVAVRVAPAPRQPAGLVHQAPSPRGTSISAGGREMDAVDPVPTARTEQPETGVKQGREREER